MHVAEAGTGVPVILCHGFPHLWYSWRHQIPVLAEAGWRVVAPVELQTVCVRHEPLASDGTALAGEALDAHTTVWVEAVNHSGAAYLTPAVLDGRWMARVSIGALATETSDVAAVWAAMQEAAEESAT